MELDFEFYISYYKDLKENGIDTKEKAHAHWIKFGKQENRYFNKIVYEDKFDWKFYVNEYSDLKKHNINCYERAYNHWIKFGKKEGRICNKIFKTKSAEKNYNTDECSKKQLDITFIVTGHCMKIYPDNSQFMINTLNSFKLIKNFNNSRVIISLDGNENSELDEKYNIYKKNLQQYINGQSNFEIVCHEKNLNLVNNIYETLKLVKTKYIFLIQQDLQFVQSFNLERIINDLDNLPQIKHLRFNDTINKRIKGRNDDNSKFGEKRIKRNCTYLSTGIYCDRNHISRLEYYTDFIFKDGVLKKPSNWRYPCFGMENLIAQKPMSEHDAYGTYIYGDFNIKPMILHNKAGRGNSQKFIEEKHQIQNVQNILKNKLEQTVEELVKNNQELDENKKLETQQEINKIVKPTVEPKVESKEYQTQLVTKEDTNSNEKNESIVEEKVELKLEENVGKNNDSKSDEIKNKLKLLKNIPKFLEDSEDEAEEPESPTSIKCIFDDKKSFIDTDEKESNINYKKIEEYIKFYNENKNIMSIEDLQFLSQEISKLYYN